MYKILCTELVTSKELSIKFSLMKALETTACLYDEKVLLFDQISAPSFSRHDLILLIYNFKYIVPDNSFTFRDLKSVNSDLLISSANSIDWDQIFFMPSIDDKVKFLENCLNDLFDCVVPIKRVNIKRKEIPWLTTKIKRIIIERNQIYKRWKKYRLPEDYDKYKMIKKQVTKRIRLAKKRYYEEQFNTALSTKQTWKYIRKIGIGGNNISNK